MNIEILKNKRYIPYNLLEDANIFSEGYYSNYSVTEDFLERLSKALGFSYEVYTSLSAVNQQIADEMVRSMSKKNNIPGVTLLVDEDEEVIVDYSLEYERQPILNSEFIYRVNSLVETSNEIKLAEVHYHPNDTISSVLLKREAPLIVEEKSLITDAKQINYDIGILIVNDELSNTYSRLVLYVDGQPLYLPANYYNATTSRFKRSTNNNIEALEVLVLKIIDDLRGEELESRLLDLHYRYRANKSILATYEEYNTVLNTMRKIPIIIEDNSALEDLMNAYENFEKRYKLLEDKKSSYVWRCTAFSDITVGALVSKTCHILTMLNAPNIEYFRVRELLGSYVSTNRIAEEIAKQDS